MPLIHGIFHRPQFLRSVKFTSVPSIFLLMAITCFSVPFLLLRADLLRAKKPIIPFFSSRKKKKKKKSQTRKRFCGLIINRPIKFSFRGKETDKSSSRNKWVFCFTTRKFCNTACSWVGLGQFPSRVKGDRSNYLKNEWWLGEDEEKVVVLKKMEVSLKCWKPYLIADSSVVLFYTH